MISIIILTIIILAIIVIIYSKKEKKFGIIDQRTKTRTVVDEFLANELKRLPKGRFHFFNLKQHKRNPH